jgi:hypothetical protein
MATSPEDQERSEFGVGEIAARAFVQHGDVRAGPYSVLRLSDCAVMLAGEIPFGIGESCTVVFTVQGHQEQSVDAELVRVERFAAAHRFKMALRNVSKDVRAFIREVAPPGTRGESDSKGWQERRRFPRARVAGTAIALAGGRYSGAYVVRNLSAGGAHLVGDNNLAIGQVVQMLLQVGRGFSQSLEAEVVRREKLPSGEQSFAVAFRNLAPDVEDSLQTLALLALENSVVKRAATVLVLRNGPSAVVSALEDSLHSLGHEMVVVVTPLDALSLLSSDTHRIVGVVVGCDLAHTEPLGFLSFLKDAYPHIRRLALPGDSRPAQLERAIATGVVEAVLGPSWDIDLLSKALRPPSS